MSASHIYVGDFGFDIVQPAPEDVISGTVTLYLKPIDLSKPTITRAASISDGSFRAEITNATKFATAQIGEYRIVWRVVGASATRSYPAHDDRSHLVIEPDPAG